MKGIGVIIPTLKITEVVLESCDRIVLETHQYRGGMTTPDVEQVLKEEEFETKIDSEFVYGQR